MLQADLVLIVVTGATILATLAFWTALAFWRLYWRWRLMMAEKRYRQLKQEFESR